MQGLLLGFHGRILTASGACVRRPVRTGGGARGVTLRSRGNRRVPGLRV
jgi:hypothetical protein